MRIATAVALAATLCLIDPSASRANPADLAAAWLQEPKEGAAPADAASGLDRAALAAAYARIGGRLVWIADRRPTARAEALVATLAGLDAEALNPEDYRADALQDLAATLAAGGAADADLARFELALSDALGRYARDLQGGRLAQIKLPADVLISPRAIDVGAILGEALASEDPLAAVRARAVAWSDAQKLKAKLAEMRALAAAGGWPVLPAGPTLEPGAFDSRVPTLRRRLAVTDGAEPVPPKGVSPTHYEPRLVEAMKRFQARHGLNRDGRIGNATRETLNVSAQERVRQIEISLERQRWRPDRAHARFVYVNVAAQTLQVFENGEVTMDMNVVVGRPDRATPILDDRIVNFRLNPPWGVPQRNAEEDVLPKLRKDPHSLVEKGYKIYDAKGVELDPMGVEWDKVKQKGFPYRIRQEPGPANPLGQIRFSLTNKLDIYLHDTSERHLFKRDVRTLSSGCIRVEHPMRLAEFALQGTPGWTMDRLQTQIGSRVTSHVPLAQPLPVHITYVTAWVDAQGQLQLRDDIYGHDARLARALAQRARQVAAAR